MPLQSQGTPPPTLTVIVAAYNIADFIGECLDSLLTEPDGRHEIIVVDDGSTDATPDILTERGSRHPQLKVIRQKNGGPGAARNTGINAASGAYVTFIDGDDWVQPNYISTCLAEISADPETELWVFDYMDITSTGSLRQSCTADFWSCRNAPWNKIFRRDLIDNERFDEDILYEDLATVRPWVARAKCTRHVNRALYNYRNQRAGSIMNSIDTARFSELIMAANRCVQRVESSLGAGGAQRVLGKDWRRRFYTGDVFVPGLVQWSRKIDESALRLRYAAEFMAHFNANTDGISTLRLTRDFGLKFAIAAFCYEHGASIMGDVLLHRIGHMKRRLMTHFSSSRHPS